MYIYLLNIGTFIAIYAILASTLNVMIGYTGVFTMAHAAFFGVGAYVAAFVAINFTASLPLVLLVSMLVAAVLSLIIALPALRVRNEYFVVVSLAIQILCVTVFSEWKGFTGGLGGIVNIPMPTLFFGTITTHGQFLALAVVCLVAVMAIIGLAVKGSFGRSLMAVRDDEAAALALGKNVALIKTLSVALASGLTAVGGVVYAFFLSFINVQSFTLDVSVLLIAMVIVGGTGTLFGPIVGAALLMILPNALSYIPYLPSTEIGSVQQALYGLAMVLMMIFRPGGVAGVYHRGRKGPNA